MKGIRIETAHTNADADAEREERIAENLESRTDWDWI